MKNLEYNPVFESLISDVRKFGKTNLYEQETNPKEATGAQIDAKDIEKYLILILDALQINVITFTIKLPPDLINTILPKVMESLQKMSNNASMDALMEGLNDMWKICYDAMKAYKGPEAQYYTPVYDKVNEGVGKALEAYGALKKKVGSRINDKDLLGKINGLMKNQIDAVIKSIQGSQQQVKK